MDTNIGLIIDITPELLIECFKEINDDSKPYTARCPVGFAINRMLNDGVYARVGTEYIQIFAFNPGSINKLAQISTPVDVANWVSLFDSWFSNEGSKLIYPQPGLVQTMALECIQQTFPLKTSLVLEKAIAKEILNVN